MEKLTFRRSFPVLQAGLFKGSEEAAGYRIAVGAAAGKRRMKKKDSGIFGGSGRKVWGTAGFPGKAVSDTCRIERTGDRPGNPGEGPPIFLTGDGEAVHLPAAAGHSTEKFKRDSSKRPW